MGGDTGDREPRPDLDEAERPNFEGHEGRECGEHRTVGPHRAWCYDCGEWCYPGEGCAYCEQPRLRAALADAQAEIERLRAAWAELAAKLETLDDVSDDLDTHADSLPYRPDAERARGVAQGVRETAGQLRALAAAPVAPGRRTLTDDEYRRAVELCERVVDAAHSDDGGPTVAGHYIGKLRDLLAGADWREQP